MTVRQLIEALEACDEDVKDYDVGVVFRVQVSKDVRLSGRSYNIVVPEGVDVGASMLWLKAR